MNPRRRLVLLVLIMCAVVVVVQSFSVTLLYQTSFEQQRRRLVEKAKSQARLIESVARFDRQTFGENNHEQAARATLSQVRDAHARYRGYSDTGEFTLSMREGDNIIFLLNQRHNDLRVPKPVPWNSTLAEPMRRALKGQSGTVLALDYRGVRVLAAHEPVAELNLGIVTKIDLDEVKKPFFRAGLLGGLIAIFAIGLGATIFVRVINPIIRDLGTSVKNLEHALSEVRTLRGILPICSYCKKIRDDKGYWEQVEVYVKQCTDANFTHGICPDCLKEHFPEFTSKMATNPNETKRVTSSHHEVPQKTR